MHVKTACPKVPANPADQLRKLRQFRIERSGTNRHAFKAYSRTARCPLWRENEGLETSPCLSVLLCRKAMMKNPLMSMGLSAANKAVGTARGQATAAVKSAATKATKSGATAAKREATKATKSAVAAGTKQVLDATSAALGAATKTATKAGTKKRR